MAERQKANFWFGVLVGWAITLAVIVVTFYFIELARAAEIEVQGDWTQDCHGTRVIVEQAGIAHFEVSCNGLQVESVEVEDKPKAKRDAPPELLMSVGYPAPPTVEPYPAPPTSVAPFIYWAPPTIEPTSIEGYEKWRLGGMIKVYLKSPVKILDRMTKGVDNFYLVEYDGMELWGRPFND